MPGISFRPVLYPTSGREPCNPGTRRGWERRRTPVEALPHAEHHAQSGNVIPRECIISGHDLNTPYPYTMAPRIFLALVALIGLMWYLSWYRKSSPEKRNKSLITLMLYGVGAALLILVVTGKIPWLFAIVSAAVPWINRVLTMHAIWQRFSGHRQSGPRSSRQSPGTASMSVEEALEVLGLQPGASKEEIVTAHKRLMQKIHPDKGGSGYLARRINQAKDVLLD